MQRAAVRTEVFRPPETTDSCVRFVCSDHISSRCLTEGPLAEVAASRQAHLVSDVDLHRAQGVVAIELVLIPHLDLERLIYGHLHAQTHRHISTTDQG